MRTNGQLFLWLCGVAVFITSCTLHRVSAAETDAEQQIQRAALEATQFDQRLSRRTAANLEMARTRRVLKGNIQRVSSDLKEVRQAAADLQRQFKRIQKKVDTLGLTATVGQVLRKQRATLPSVSKYRQNLGLLEPEIHTVQLAVMELEDQNEDRADTERTFQRAVEQLELTDTDLDATGLADQLRRVLESERQFATALLADYRVFLDRLLNLKKAQDDLIADREEFVQYIDERVLWVRSARIISLSEFPKAFSALGWLTDVSHWQALGLSLMADLRQRWFYYALAIVLAIGAQVAGWRLIRARERPRSEVGKRKGRLVRVPRDAAEVFLSAIAVPGLMWMVGWRLIAQPHSGEFAVAIGQALKAAGAQYLALALLYQMTQPAGFARRHLGWTAIGLQKLRRLAFLLMVTIVPLSFVIVALDFQEDIAWQDSLGRFLFVASVLIVTWLVPKLLNPHRGAIYVALGRAGENYRSSWRWLLYLLGISIHLGLAALAAFGFYYTAARLGEEVRATTALLTILVLVGSLLIHGAKVNHRRLAWRRLAVRRAEAAAARREHEPELPRVQARPAESRTSDIRPLIRTLLITAGIVGLTLIWMDVVPALGIVNDLDLWDKEVNGSATMTLPDGSTTVREYTEYVPVTLGNLVLAIFIVLATIIASRYLAGLFELPFLARLPIDKALENTITTVARYVLWIVAIIVATASLGFSWGKVQWIVAALSLGIGFGLQEIFANFISGLIILFERPMRVGDVITVGDKTGIVQRIRIRATTIMDWDHKELIVPNKEFATGRLLNWTLTNRVNRRVIFVGVQHGTDANQVRDLLLKIANENRRVVADPKPKAVLEQITDSALTFSLRVYHQKISDRLRGLHELNHSIQEAFKAAGIKFAFPQRDIHMHEAEPSLSLFEPDDLKPEDAEPPS